ncbi:DUF411 domain-containing protein [Aquabacterium parvum]|uniref:DUF411 domain-containing protein n=1 Tax=Aquabacterium parvum TaxID=70584 RepID=UPI000718F0B7|nr:DUF411 domain-containing protein [Aquabacterium parvum]
MRKFVGLQRRQWLAGALILVTAGAWAKPIRPLVEVWKDPQCGCCKDWVAHMEKAGFDVRVHETGNADARKRLGIPDKWGSCHTASVGGYVLEGHVPARDVQRLLKEKPLAVGLAVPGMPVGSPGMDGPAYGNRRDPHDVLLVQADGHSTVYQSYR